MSLPRCIITILLLSLFAASARAQSGAQATQSVIAGGGGTSANGPLQVEATAGQSVTGTASGGTFQVESGFWAGAAAKALASLSVNSVAATYGGTLNLKATLSATGANLSGKQVTFFLNGTNVGMAVTDASGVATLNNVSLGVLNAGTYATGIAVDFAGDVELSSVNGTGQLIVSKADPVLSVTGGSFTYDGQPHAATASASGVAGEALGPVSLLYNGAASVPVNAGSYAITAAFAGNQNYNPATNNQQSVIIAQANQAITFAALSDKTFGDADFTVSATASSLHSVTFAASGQCSVTGSTVHITGAGSCTITASQSGDSNYNAAPQVQHTFSIGQAAATVTLSNLSQTYDGSAKAATVHTNPQGKSVALSYSRNGTSVASPVDAGSYDVTATIDDANYQGSATGVLVINKATPVINWSKPASVVFGSPLGSVQLSATASVAGTFQYNPPAGAVLSVGIHQLSVSFTPADAANYTTAQASVSLTVDAVTAPAFNFNEATYNAGEGDGHVIITVNRTGNTAGAASVNYTTSDTAALADCAVFNGIASSRCDYATTVGTLRFAAGETSRTIIIPLVDDSYAEGPESFSIALSDADGESLGAVSTATITIADNDAVTGANPIDGTDFFIREHYIDFLGREPEPGGFAGWKNILNNCAAGDKTCDHVEVSAGFFRSEEFQTRGYFIYKFYSAVGRIPLYPEFMPDLAKVSGFLSDTQLEANKEAYASEFTSRQEFKNKYDQFQDPADYVNALLATVGLPNHPSRAGWTAGLKAGSLTRARVLRELTESAEMRDKYYTEAFVIMQYFGYLRRTADSSYTGWLEIMNKDRNDYRTMINGFLNSDEYRKRFSQ